MNRLDSSTETGAVTTKRRRNAPAPARSRKIGNEFIVSEVRINSLKVLAQTLLREVDKLEAQGCADTLDALDLAAEVHRFEAQLIRSTLIHTGGRQRRAARLLGMKATTLNAKIKRYRIEPNEGTQ